MKASYEVIQLRHHESHNAGTIVKCEQIDDIAFSVNVVKTNTVKTFTLLHFVINTHEIIIFSDQIKIR